MRLHNRRKVREYAARTLRAEGCLGERLAVRAAAYFRAARRCAEDAAIYSHAKQHETPDYHDAAIDNLLTATHLLDVAIVLRDAAKAVQT